MANKQENKRVLGFIIILVLILLLIYQPGGPSQTVENIQNLINQNTLNPNANTGTDPDTDFITVRLYDKDKKLITPSSAFSIVEGVPGVYYIDLTVNLRNTGTKSLSCDIISLSPVAFNSAMTKGIKTLPVSGKVAWTSNLIDVQPLESTSNVVFSATARCSYSSGTGTVTLPDKTGTLSLSITSEGEAGFDIEVTTGGTPDEYCGDGICQTNEDSVNCPDDCAITTYVAFRTSDLSYVSGSAVGHSSSCGSALTAYGYVSSTGTLTGDCTSISTWCGSSPTKALSNLPGGWKAGGPAPSLWKVSDSSIVCVCDSDGSKYSLIKYSTTDSDKSNVDTDPVSFDVAKEVAC